MKKIIIENTRGIKHLEFSLPERHGVYILAGANGAGKTTLLTTLCRLCNHNAFRYGLPKTGNLSNCDSYENSRITYTVNDKAITFKKSLKNKWIANHHNYQKILKLYGYKASVFIKADEHRLAPTNDDLRIGNFVDVKTDVKNILNDIFETTKYSSLVRLRNTNGRGCDPTYFYLIKDKDNYYSEKTFSSGEISMIHLVENIANICRHSLILLDEAELALHPRIQLNLIRYLKTISAKMGLTVFISTHSPTVIRDIEAENIYFLEKKEGGAIEVISPCYPAYAIGLLDDLGQYAPDGIICVEDEYAYLIAKYLIEHYFNIETKKIKRRPEIRIIPVGGYVQTLNFVEKSKKVLFQDSRICALLDHDVFDNKEGKHILKRYKVKYFDLGITPEYAIINLIENEDDDILRFLKETFFINFSNIKNSKEYKEVHNSINKEKSSSSRAAAKKKLKLILDAIEKSSFEKRDVALNKLVNMYIARIYNGDSAFRYASKFMSFLLN